jgi:uncharacterized protein with von Willebrand factor type A (vWA) domain
MKKLYFLTIIWTFSFGVLAQENLVNNPSFEKGVFVKRGVYPVKKGKRLIDFWGSPRKENAYLFYYPTRSVAVANSGQTSVGVNLGSGRQEKTKFQFITGKLKEPLEKGKIYCVCFNTLLHRSSKWAAKDVGLLFHKSARFLENIHDPTSLIASLYVNGGDYVTNTKWKEFCGYYLATGGEEYITFGKFGNSDATRMKDLGYEPYFELEFQNQALYQLDDISVTLKSENADCGCAEDPPIPEEEIEILQKQAHAPYLFALDASGSMKKEGLFDSLRLNLYRFVKKLPEQTPVSFVTFASTSRKVYAGKITTGTAEKIDSLLDRASVGGGTNVFLGLQMAYESWFVTEPDSAKMVLITDGEFHVNPKIVGIIKNEYETKGRKLTLIQIGARASGLEQVKPYMDDYIYTNQSELEQAVNKVYEEQFKGGSGETAYSCECEEEYSDTMNYHFVIDYSGSMAQEKSRATMALRYLFNKAPENAMISVTSFNTQATQLYVGKKSDITMGQLSILLARGTGGGTDPVPGVQNALRLAKSMSENRFSHIILITDYSAIQLSRLLELGQSMKQSSSEFDMAGYSIEVGSDGLVTTYSEFDKTTANYAGVSRQKFEKDLFFTQRSSCNFTSQPYHYNPAKAAAKNGTRKFFGRVLTGVVTGAVTN